MALTAISNNIPNNNFKKMHKIIVLSFCEIFHRGIIYQN